MAKTQKRSISNRNVSKARPKAQKTNKNIKKIKSLAHKAPRKQKAPKAISTVISATITSTAKSHAKLPKKATKKVNNDMNGKRENKQPFQQNSSSKIRKSIKPFPHFQIPGFLSKQDYQRCLKTYEKLNFKEKESDLFHFYQTDELAKNKSIGFFEKALSQQFQNITSLKDSWFHIFASYYFEGNYLLCHDDVIEDRQYAFSYYLEDFPSGELVLYNDKATKQVKRIKVRKNTLVIFEVSNISYHEVAHCDRDGRKAITGWLYKKGHAKTRPIKEICPFVPNVLNDAIEYPIDSKFLQEEFLSMPDIGYELHIKSKKQIGPFYSKKLLQLKLDPCVVFTLEGYSLLNASFQQFREGDYLLLNDPVNRLSGEDIVDIFVVLLPKGVQDDDQHMTVQMANQNEELGGMPYINDQLYIVRRYDKQYYVPRNQRPFYLLHFIYKEDKKKSKAKSLKKKKNN